MTADPIFRYPGAKWGMASWITSHLPRAVHYVEPFCGSAAVFFNLPWRPKHAVLNDLSGDIVNLFRVIREQADALAAAVEMTPWSRGEYEACAVPVEEPVERARRFLVRTWQGHKKGGWITTGTSEPGIPGGGRYWPEYWSRIPQRITATAVALRGAEIEQQDAMKLLRRYAAPDVLLYVDPPYPLATRTGALYAHEMTDGDHVALLDALDAHPGPVVLSGYACPLYDNRLAHWHRATARVQAEGGTLRTEVLWLNDRAAGTRQVDMFAEAL